MTTQELNERRRESVTLEDNKLAVVDRRSANLAHMQPAIDPLLAVMDKLANNPNLDADKLERLLNVFIDGQRKMAEMADERAYYEQMADFKRNPPEVVKRLTAKIKGTTGGGKDYAFDVPYADLNAFADAAMADLAARGITWDFEVVDAPNLLTVTCLMHYGIYTRRGSTITGDPASLQSPNAFMKKGAAQSFLMRYSFCASTGLTAALPGDKNGANLTPGAPEAVGMDAKEVQTWVDAMNNAPSYEAMKGVFAECYKRAKDAKDETAKKRFTSIYEALKREFAEGSR